MLKCEVGDNYKCPTCKWRDVDAKRCNECFEKALCINEDECDVCLWEPREEVSGDE